MENPKVLIAVPYHEKKAYCKKQLDACLSSLTYKNKEIIIRYDPNEYGSKDSAKKQREFFRVLALLGHFDYLFFLGADTLPEKDVIEKLLYRSIPNDISIIGGVYWGRSNAENGDPAKAVAWIHDMSQAQQSEVFIQRDLLILVDGMGMDCVLISKDALENNSFLAWEQNDDDYPFYDKAKALGHETYIDTSVQAKHYFSETGYVERGRIFYE
jgi:hypothetical protein